MEIEKKISYWNNFWEDLKENVPWETNEIDETLFNFLKNKNFSSAIELGCGSGLNALLISNFVLNCDGIDISDFAINLAKKRNIYQKVNFKVEDVLSFKTEQKYDLVFDRGCFHGFDTDIDRYAFVKKVDDLLEVNGKWLSLIGSCENIHNNLGPPRYSLTQISSYIEPFLKIEEVQECGIKNKGGIFSPGWKIVSSKRKYHINKSF